MNTDTAPASTSQTHSTPLYRPDHDRMVAGVAAGVARYLGADVIIIRILFVALAVIGGAGIPIYLAAWLLMPEEGSDKSIANEFLHSRQARSN